MIKKLFWKIFGHTVSIGLFLGLFLGSLFITYGYRYNFYDNTVVQTSIIDVCTVPDNGDLYLDDEKYGDGSCMKIYGLDLGNHTLEIKKDGYKTWKKNLYLNKDIASVYSNIVLIPDEIITIDTLAKDISKVWTSPNESKYAIYDEPLDVIIIYSASKSTPKYIDAPFKIKDILWLDENTLIIDGKNKRYKVNTKNGEWSNIKNVLLTPKTKESELIINGGEIYTISDGKKLFITRYSNDITSAKYFYNKGNILLTTSTEIKLCDKEGENCHLLSYKDEDTPIGNPKRSRKIVFMKNGDLMEINLNVDKKIVEAINI